MIHETFEVVLSDLASFIMRVYPLDPEETELTSDSIKFVLQLDARSLCQITCKRALLLMALHFDPEIAQYFDGTHRPCKLQDLDLLSDLKVRILPCLVPLYLRGMCQRPDLFVDTALGLHLLWPGEDIRAIEQAHTVQISKSS